MKMQEKEIESLRDSYKAETEELMKKQRWLKEFGIGQHGPEYES